MLLSHRAIFTRTVSHMTNYMSQTVLNIAIGYLAINKWVARTSPQYRVVPSFYNPSDQRTPPF